MNSDAEIWRAARDLIADHGPRRAETHATKVLAEMTLGGDFAGTPAGSCIARVVRGATFAPFSKPRFRVIYPFSL